MIPGTGDDTVGPGTGGMTASTAHAQLSASVDEPFYLPGSVCSATVIIRCTKRAGNGSGFSRSESLQQGSDDGLSSFPSFPRSGSHLDGDGERTDRATGVHVNVIACEFIGKWNGHRSWVKPHTHGSYERADVISTLASQPLDMGPTDIVLERARSVEKRTSEQDFLLSKSGSARDSLDNRNSFDGRTSPMRRRSAGANIGENGSALTSAETTPAWRDALDDAAAAGHANGSSEAFGGFVFRSQPHIVASEDLVFVDSQMCFKVKCRLPVWIPPTFRGTGVRYWYALTIAVAVDGGSPRSLRVPFRVLSSASAIAASGPRTGAGVPSVPAAPLFAPQDQQQLESASRFLVSDRNLGVLDICSDQVPHQNVDNLQMALALSLNGRLTSYRTDEELWKSGRDEDDIAASDEGLWAEIQQLMDSRQETNPAARESGNSRISTAPGGERMNPMWDSARRSGAQLSNSKSRSGVDFGSGGAWSRSETPIGENIMDELCRELRDASAPSLVRKRGHTSSREGGSITGSLAGGSGGAAPGAPKVMPVYVISKGNHRLVSIHIPQRAHRLGDILCSIFDFSARELPCLRLQVRLEMQEVILPKVALGTKDQASTDVADGGVTFRRVYGEHEEIVVNSESTSVMFAIPHDAPVSFCTDAVAVRWFIHFNFFTPSAAALARACPLSSALRIPPVSAAESSISGSSRLGQENSTSGPDAGEASCAKAAPKERSEAAQAHLHGRAVASTNELALHSDIETLSWSLPIVVAAGDSQTVPHRQAFTVQLR